MFSAVEDKRELFNYHSYRVSVLRKVTPCWLSAFHRDILLFTFLTYSLIYLRRKQRDSSKYDVTVYNIILYNNITLVYIWNTCCVDGVFYVSSMVYNSSLQPGLFIPRGYAKTSYINQNATKKQLELWPVITLALMKIRPRTEMLACQKQAQSSH
jgi:hypothetical protein